nr:hypothetical protein Iba_chr01aCG17850 [Ipomoea batatas]
MNTIHFSHSSILGCFVAVSSQQKFLAKLQDTLGVCREGEIKMEKYGNWHEEKLFQLYSQRNRNTILLSHSVDTQHASALILALNPNVYSYKAKTESEKSMGRSLRSRNVGVPWRHAGYKSAEAARFVLRSPMRTLTCSSASLSLKAQGGILIR